MRTLIYYLIIILLFVTFWLGPQNTWVLINYSYERLLYAIYHKCKYCHCGCDCRKNKIKNIDTEIKNIEKEISNIKLKMN